MFKRRVGIVLVAVLALGLGAALAAQELLDSALIPKYQAGLVIPPSMPARTKLFFLDYYEIAVRQFQQQILPLGFAPATTVWSYGPAWESAADNEGLHATAGGHYFYPAFTIEARSKKPVRVKWVNELKTGSGAYRPHLLAVDPTLHWANPPGGVMGRDMRPEFTETPGPYTGPVPMVSHLHGSVGIGDESDGYTEAWYLPAANNIPAGYAKVGTWHQFFKVKAQLKFGQRWGERIRGLPISERPKGRDPLVSRSHAGDDAAQRLCRPGGLLPRPRRGRGPGPRLQSPERNARRRGRPLADHHRGPDRHPGPLVQDRWFAVLPRYEEILRRHFRTLYALLRPFPHLESGVLRQRHRRQRPDLALYAGRAAALSLPRPQRLQLAGPHPEVQRPQRPGVADRDGGRLPAGPPGRRRLQCDRCSAGRSCSGWPSGPT